MELDHVFLFTEKSELAAKTLAEFGLTEGTPNVHPGQGTACRRFFFQNAYLELVWVIDETEIKAGPLSKTKLWERSQHVQTNYCPLGLCFRRTNRDSDSITPIFEDSWRYHSAFLPEGQYANVGSNENFPAEPMLFEMPFFRMAPKDYPLQKRQAIAHERGFKEITKLQLTLPIDINNLSPSMAKVVQESIVSLSSGKEYQVLLEFDDGKHGGTKNFAPLIPLTLNGSNTSNLRSEYSLLPSIAEIKYKIGPLISM